MASSQNGWTVIASGSDARLRALPWITGRVLAGDVWAVLDYVARRFNAEVEPVTPGWSWGYAYRSIRGQTSGYSNHASGTAIDLNAPLHPLGAVGTFTAAQAAAVRAIVAAVNAAAGATVLRWGGDYSGRKDEMHLEIVGTAAAVARAAAAIRAGLVANPTPVGGTVPDVDVTAPDPLTPIAPPPEEDPSVMNADYITALYWAGMRRAPTAKEVDDRVRQMADDVISGQSVAAALQRQRDSILTSEEAIAWTVTRAYQDGLGRQPDATGKAAHIAAVHAGRLPHSLGAIAAALQSTTEGRKFLAKPKTTRDAAIAAARSAVPAYRR